MPKSNMRNSKNTELFFFCDGLITKSTVKIDTDVAGKVYVHPFLRIVHH